MKKKIIQSYVSDKYFVSTIERDSSVPISPPPRFFETIVWQWDSATKERGKLIQQAADSVSGIRTHARICELLLKHGEEALIDFEQ